MAHLLPDLDPTDKAALPAQVASFYSRAIEDGRVLVNGALPPKAGLKLKAGDVIDAFRKAGEEKQKAKSS
ncbi:MAG TPA: hypothetical protein EYP98_21955 [Planctomycetes bacterium]|nr:hypothetical protein [Planctomycetota bacterium]